MSKSEPDIIRRTRVVVISLVALLIVGVVGSAVVWRTRLSQAVDGRLANHRLPKDLNQLVPEFLSAVPSDPFDGVPLRYKQLAKGYVVYSVGPDGHDDGGKEPPAKRRKAERVPEDITIAVER